MSFFYARRKSIPPAPRFSPPGENTCAAHPRRPALRGPLFCGCPLPRMPLVRPSCLVSVSFFYARRKSIPLCAKVFAPRRKHLYGAPAPPRLAGPLFCGCPLPRMPLVRPSCLVSVSFFYARRKSIPLCAKVFAPRRKHLYGAPAPPRLAGPLFCGCPLPRMPLVRPSCLVSVSFFYARRKSIPLCAKVSRFLPGPKPPSGREVARHKPGRREPVVHTTGL